MKKKQADLILRGVFWAQVVIFLLILSIFFIPVIREIFKGIQFLLPFLVFSLLGLVLIYLTLKSKIKGKLKKFLLLTGASSAGIFISILLHNLIYGFSIFLFGPGFWQRSGLEDEPLFFFLSLFVCPIGFLIGSICSAFLLLRKKP